MPAQSFTPLPRAVKTLEEPGFDHDPGVQLMLKVQRDEPGAFEELMETWRLPLKARFLSHPKALSTHGPV